MSKLSPLFQKMIDSSNQDKDMILACETNTFYAVSIDCLNGVQNIGSSEDPDGKDMPLLYTTRKEAFAEIQEEVDRYAEEILSGDRDEDDEYEGQLFVVKWDGESKNMVLYDENHMSNPIYEGDWKSMSGIAPENFEYDNSGMGM